MTDFIITQSNSELEGKFWVTEKWERPSTLILEINTFGKKLKPTWRDDFMKLLNDNITDESLVLTQIQP